MVEVKRGCLKAIGRYLWDYYLAEKNGEGV